jgi:hypothetical protein
LEKREDDSLNIIKDDNNQNAVNFLYKKKNYKIVKGDILKVKLVKQYSKMDRNVIMACDLDLNNFTIN